MALLPRKLSVQQGTAGAPVKTPAEDWRLNDGGMWTPGGTDGKLTVRSGVLPQGNGPGLAVTAGAGGVFTIQPGRFVKDGAAALQGAYRGTVDQVTTRTIAGTDLPASGSFRAGYLGIKVYDQVYGDTQDGADIIYVVGASAATAAAAAYPVAPTNFLQLRAFTVDSTGAVTFTSYLPPSTVVRGGILPVDATDTGGGWWDGQYRDSSVLGLQRWSPSLGWIPVAVDTAPIALVRRNASQQSIINGTWTVINYDTLDYDTEAANGRTAMWTSSNNPALIVQRAGYYRIHTQVTFQNSAAGRRLVMVLRGDQGNAGIPQLGSVSMGAPSGAAVGQGIAYLPVGAQLLTQVYQDSGATLITDNATWASTFFSMQWLRS